MDMVTTSTAVTVSRERHAKRIRELSKRWAANTVALGAEFRVVRDTFPLSRGGSNHRPGWHDWVKSNTDWHHDHVSRFIRIADRFSSIELPSNLSTFVLTYLSRDTVPQKGVEAVLNAARAGEDVSVEKAKQIVKPYLRTRAEAIKHARETGTLVPARDGNLYSGASEDEMAAYSKRRSAVYGIRRAVDAIADSEFAPKDWVDISEPHWVAGLKLASVDAAIEWLTSLKPHLQKKQGVV